jgi:hypothetical protein
VGNANAAKGSRWELAITKFLADTFGRHVIRPQQAGWDDVGDIHLHPFVIQAKDERSHNFSGYINDAEKQAKAAEFDYGVAVVKRRNYSPRLAYVVMTLETFRRVVLRLRRAEELLARYAPEIYHTEHLPKIEKDKLT